MPAMGPIAAQTGKMEANRLYIESGLDAVEQRRALLVLSNKGQFQGRS